MRKISVMVVFVCAAFAVASWSQVITGTVSGTVRDTSGAVLPGVTIQVQNTNTGVGRTLLTDERGYYTAPNLSPGNDQVSASLQGFQMEVRRGFSVNVGQTSVIDFSLQVGAVTETVEVSAEAPQVETTNAVVIGLVTENYPAHAVSQSGRSNSLQSEEPGSVF